MSKIPSTHLTRRDILKGGVVSAAALAAAGRAAALTPIGGSSASGGGGPTYTPFLASVMGAGTVGSNATADFNNLSGRTTLVSNDIAGPFGESQVVKVTAAVANSGNYGGSFNNSSSPMSAGDTMWLRSYYYFPSSFCAGCGGGGDFDTRIKFLRPTYVNGDRYYAQLGGLTNNSCPSTSVAPLMYGSDSDFAPVSNNWLVTPVLIPRDQWVALQWMITCGATAGATALMCWVGSTNCGPSTITEPSYPPSASDLSFVALGDYWNGGPQQDTSFYISNTVFTKQAPNTLDSGGHPYVSPLTKISDF